MQNTLGGSLFKNAPNQLILSFWGQKYKSWTWFAYVYLNRKVHYIIWLKDLSVDSGSIVLQAAIWPKFCPNVRPTPSCKHDLLSYYYIWGTNGGYSFLGDTVLTFKSWKCPIQLIFLQIHASSVPIRTQNGPEWYICTNSSSTLSSGEGLVWI